MKHFICVLCILIVAACLAEKTNPKNSTTSDGSCFRCDQAPAGTIFCDDFENSIPLKNKYFEYNDAGGRFVLDDHAGQNGSRGMKVIFRKGDVDVGWLKKSIGRAPGAYISKNASEPDKDFNEIYWRVDLKRQAGWKGGGGDKLTRATVMVNENWAQGAIGHLWSSGNYLVMDPASGIDEQGKLVSTKYNDFDNLRWNLGKKNGSTDIYSDETAGQWFCVEGHMKLNTPGQKDGLFEFWINDKLQGTTNAMNWHGDWNRDANNMKINAVFFENYWNKGSVQDQERYMDNIVISTERIGCSCGK
jgi:hypothetical protein